MRRKCPVRRKRRVRQQHTEDHIMAGRQSGRAARNKRAEGIPDIEIKRKKKRGLVQRSPLLQRSVFSLSVFQVQDGIPEPAQPWPFATTGVGRLESKTSDAVMN